MADRSAEDPSPPTVFVSYSLTDTDAAALLAYFGPFYNIVEAATWSSDKPLSLAIRDAITLADVVVVLLPTTDDRSRDSVFFEAGMAHGIGKPVIVVGDETRVPRDLASLPRIRTDDLANLQSTIRNMSSLRRNKKAVERQRHIGEPALNRSQLDEMHATMPRPRDGVVLEIWIGKLLQLAGATVEFSDQEKGITRPDLSIWHDNLQSPFGLPLPVEVLASTRSIRPIRDRLLRLMRVSGANSLLAVAGPDQSLHQRWSDGVSLILAVDAAALLDALGRQALPLALATLLASATPSD